MLFKIHSKHSNSNITLIGYILGFPDNSDGKEFAAVQETWVRSLSWADPLEKELATHSSTLAWKIPRTEKSDRPQSKGWQRVGHN